MSTLFRKKDFYVVRKIFLPLLEKNSPLLVNKSTLLENISTLLEKDSHLCRNGKISAFIGKKISIFVRKRFPPC